MLEKVQSLTHQRRELDWVAPIDSTIVRVYQHGATLHRDTGDRDTGGGLGRTTRNSGRSRLIMLSVALVVA